MLIYRSWNLTTQLKASLVSYSQWVQTSTYLVSGPGSLKSEALWVN